MSYRETTGETRPRSSLVHHVLRARDLAAQVEGLKKVQAELAKDVADGAVSLLVGDSSARIAYLQHKNNTDQQLKATRANMAAAHEAAAPFYSALGRIAINAAMPEGIPGLEHKNDQPPIGTSTAQATGQIILGNTLQ